MKISDDRQIKGLIERIEEMIPFSMAGVPIKTSDGRKAVGLLKQASEFLKELLSWRQSTFGGISHEVRFIHPKKGETEGSVYYVGDASCVLGKELQRIFCIELDSWTGTSPAVKGNRDQIAKYAHIVTLINEIAHTAYNNGFQKGRSIIDGMIDGSLTVDKINEMQAQADEYKKYRGL